MYKTLVLLLSLNFSLLADPKKPNILLNATKKLQTFVLTKSNNMKICPCSFHNTIDYMKFRFASHNLFKLGLEIRIGFVREEMPPFAIVSFITNF